MSAKSSGRSSHRSSDRLPQLATGRSTNRSTVRLRPQKSHIDSPHLPPIAPLRPEALWHRLHTKLNPIILPKIFIDEREAEAERIEQDRRLSILPRVEAKLLQSFDYFQKFLSENEVNSVEFTDFAKFTRQIDTINEEIKAYDLAASVLDEMAVTRGRKFRSHEELSAEFSRLIEDYALKSFELCSLKSREEHANTKFQLQKAAANKTADLDEEKHLQEEQRLLQNQIAALDATIFQTFKNV